MTRFYLLNPGDFIMADDEMLHFDSEAMTGFVWNPAPKHLIGQRAHANENPLRRELSRHQLLKLTVEAKMESICEMSNPEP